MFKLNILFVGCALVYLNHNANAEPCDFSDSDCLVENINAYNAKSDPISFDNLSVEIGKKDELIYAKLDLSNVKVDDFNTKAITSMTDMKTAIQDGSKTIVTTEAKRVQITGAYKLDAHIGAVVITGEGTFRSDEYDQYCIGVCKMEVKGQSSGSLGVLMVDLSDACHSRVNNMTITGVNIGGQVKDITSDESWVSLILQGVNDGINKRTLDELNSFFKTIKLRESAGPLLIE